MRLDELTASIFFYWKKTEKTGQTIAPYASKLALLYQKCYFKTCKSKRKCDIDCFTGRGSTIAI